MKFINDKFTIELRSNLDSIFKDQVSKFREITQKIEDKLIEEFNKIGSLDILEKEFNEIFNVNMLNKEALKLNDF